MPTTGWNSCGGRRARCSRASWTSAGAAPSSRGRSGTSSSARAWPAWSSSTSGIRPSTSGASTACRSRMRTAPGPTLRWASRSTSAASPSRARTTSRWWWTGAPRWPSRSTGQRAWTRRAWPVAGTWRCGAGPCSGWRTSTSWTSTAGPSPPRLPGRVAARTVTVSASSPTAWSWAARAHCSRRSARPGPATWATSSARSSASRTRSSARRWPACWWSRAARGRARRPWRCTEPRTCSTPTASRWNARACSWWGRTRCSCATSSRCSPRSGRPG